MALAVSAERSEGLVSDPAGRAVRCGVCSAPRIPDPALQRKVAGFAPSGISELPRISDPALVAELPGGALCGRPRGPELSLWRRVAGSALPGKGSRDLRPRTWQRCWVCRFLGSPGPLASLSEQRVGGFAPSGIPDSAPEQSCASIREGGCGCRRGLLVGAKPSPGCLFRQHVGKLFFWKSRCNGRQRGVVPVVPSAHFSPRVDPGRAPQPF